MTTARRVPVAPESKPVEARVRAFERAWNSPPLSEVPHRAGRRSVRQAGQDARGVGPSPQGGDVGSGARLARAAAGRDTARRARAANRPATDSSLDPRACGSRHETATKRKEHKTGLLSARLCDARLHHLDDPRDRRRTALVVPRTPTPHRADARASARHADRAGPLRWTSFLLSVRRDHGSARTSRRGGVEAPARQTAAAESATD